MSPASRQSSINAFYLNGGLREVIPIYPLYAVMFGEHGVSPLELSILFIIWAAVGILLEVPSGALADRFSRKWLIVASGFLKGACFLTWFLWQDFYGYALGFVLWGVASTLRSGAWEALLHDLLAEDGREAEFTRHHGRISAVATLGVMFGELMGGLLIVHGYDTVLLVSMVVPMLASTAFIVYVRDAQSDTLVAERDYFRQLHSGVAEVMKSRALLYIMLMIMVPIVSFGVFDEFSGLALFEKGFSLAAIAYLGIPIFFAQSVGHWFAHRARFLGINGTLVLLALASAMLITLPLIESWWVAVVLTLYFFVFGLTTTLFEGFLQDAIEGDARATATSVVGLGDSLGAIGWFLFFGVIAEQTSVIDASPWLGGVVVLSCTALYALKLYWRLPAR